MKIALIGDVMLARRVGKAFSNGDSPLDRELEVLLKSADYRIANLESPIVSDNVEIDDHMLFCGSPSMLNHFNLIDCFILANNHINDGGANGMTETVSHLDARGIGWHGLFKDTYEPLILEQDGIRLAIFVCADMMNEPIAANSPWKVPYVDDPWLDKKIQEYKQAGYTVLLYAHVGMLFSRYPNPPVRNLMHQKVDAGVDLVVTVHPHVVGGAEWFKGKPIYYSLGDFVMDGSSGRRRRAVVLMFDICSEGISGTEIIPTRIDSQLRTVLADRDEKGKILKSWDSVSRGLSRNKINYETFFKWQYRVEILQHILSTLMFLLKSRGLIGTLRLLRLRVQEVFLLRNWVLSDRSSKRMDDDAISDDRERLSEKDIYGD